MSQIIVPNTFNGQNHWYEKSLNATIHPMVSYFLNLNTTQIVNRYCHLRPKVDKEFLRSVLEYKPKYYLLSGADLFHVTTSQGKRNMVIIENNSCPSGQKSMPLLNEFNDKGGYKEFVEKTIKPLIAQKKKKNVAVIYDKNFMEASGYAHALADMAGEEVDLIPYYNKNDEHIRLNDGYLEFKKDGVWKRLDVVFRYLTQHPWDRLPVLSKTIIVNPVIVCLAGGRNKLMASKAYDIYNAELEAHNLKILTPETIWDVNKNEIPLWVSKFGGKAVVKIPYSNAGQGVFTITNKKELDDFMAIDIQYEKYIVQSLIGNANWSSKTSSGKYYHVGTMPNKRGESYVLDFRMMIHSTEDGYRPLSIYSRRARKPLSDKLDSGSHSWDVLGTNLSYRKEDNSWGSETSRLLLMERKEFNNLGVGIDELIEAFIQTVLSSIAIDKMAIQLIGSKGQLKRKLLRSLNDDATLLNEIMQS